MLFVDELLVVLVVVEIGEKLHQPLSIAPEDIFDDWRLLGVGHKDLKDMEGLELDVFALVLEEVHHVLEILLVRDVPCHDVEICPVQQNLSEELE